MKGLNQMLIKIFSLFLFLIFEIFSQTTKENWNKKGIDALFKKDYPEAIKSFSQTLLNSPNDAFANYNLACAYSLLYAQCEDEVGEDKIYELLQKAIRSKPTYKNKLLNDPDFSALTGQYLFQKIAGKTKKEILPSIIWYGPSPGAYGPMDQLTFKDDGTFVYSKVDFEDSIANGRLQFIGTYKWTSDNEFLIHFMNPSPLPMDGKKSELKVKYSEGKLEIQGFDHIFTDNNDRCSA